MIPFKQTCCILLLLLFPWTGFSKPEMDIDAWIASAKNTLGQVDAQVDKPISDLIPILDDILKQFQFVQTYAKTKTGSCVLTYRGSEDKSVTVKLKEFEDYTNVRIRVGMTGNDAMSREILRRLYPRL